MKKFDLKISLLFARIACWQPKPHIAYCKDSALSFWFYKKYKNAKTLYQKNIFGELWSSVFWHFSNNFNK